MMDSHEREHLYRFMPYLDGNPRRLKRIINVYNVSRRVAELRNGDGSSASAFLVDREEPPALHTEQDMFKPKLLKFAILLEQWPYRATRMVRSMAWLLRFIECMLQSNAFHNKECLPGDWKNASEKIPEVGAFLPKLLEKAGLLDPPAGAEEPDSVPGKAHKGVSAAEKKLNAILELDSVRVYKKIVQGLLYAPPDCHKHLSRDADPQDFELLLLEEPAFTVGDLRPAVDEANSDEASSNEEMSAERATVHEASSDKLLRSYAFNLPQGIMQQVARSFDELAVGRMKIPKPDDTPADADPVFFARKGQLMNMLPPR